jgi:hypothetical protein
MSRELIEHALANDCQDPDCELHNPEVGVAEGVVSETNLAYYYAGAMAMVDLLNHAIGSTHPQDMAKAELQDQLGLSLTS